VRRGGAVPIHLDHDDDAADSTMRFTPRLLGV
jgi:hypothetical protein